MVAWVMMLAGLALPGNPGAGQDAEQDVRALLAAHRRAMETADAEACFACFADDAVVLGTAPDERFTLPEYRAWSAPIFARGPRPAGEVLEEHVALAENGRLAWFDQRTRRPALGEMRVGGVLQRTEAGWRIEQLSYGFPVPNALVPALAEHLGPTDPEGAALPSGEAERMLADFHRNGAEQHLAEDAVMLGTAPDERWPMPECRDRLRTLRRQRRTVSFTPVEQHVTPAADGRHAWFDELLAVPGVGRIRATGVLRRDDGAWKIVYLNTTLAIPNEAVSVLLRLRDTTATSRELARRLLHAEHEPLPGDLDLSPATWPEGELVRYLEWSRDWGEPGPPASGSAGMVVGTSQPLAVRAGLEALERGGTAMDAACVTALTQIALNVGATVSYAGIVAMVVYDADTGEVHALMAPFATPLGEEDPLTIPASGTPSGRTALVPGFLKGIEAAHRRFGELPFASLFGPAIFFAERGIPIEGPVAQWIHSRRAVLSRLPATRAVFTSEEGEFAPPGELLRQRELASTLRHVAQEGAAYAYTGGWAEAFVRAVQEQGGKITAEDLARYQVVWSEPVRTTYRGRVLHTVAAPLIGGRMLRESLNLLELAEPVHAGPYRESAEAFYWLSACARMAWLSPEPASVSTAEASREFAGRLFERMRNPDFLRALQGQRPRARERSGGHSDAVVTVDAAGNVVALCHTINTDLWGTTGLDVGGISIPDSACFQQRRMAAAGPGGYVPNEMSPAIVSSGGEPILASSAIGRGLHETTVTCLHNVLDFGMSPEEALAMPRMLAMIRTPDAEGRLQAHKQAVARGRFPAELLRRVGELGIDTLELDPLQATGARGAWIGIAIDPESGERRGAADPFLNGAALAEARDR